MKRQIRASGRDESPKRGRRGARKCPCCGGSPCTCEKTCFCQDLKAEMTDDVSEAEMEASEFEDDLRFSFLRYGEQRL